jgi:DNA polymerase III subunit alpha
VFGQEFALGVPVPGPDDPGPMLRRLAEFMRVPMLLAPVVHFAEPVDEAAFNFLASPDGPGERTWRIAPDFLQIPTLLSQEDVLSCFEENDDVVHESGELARQCRWRPTLSRRIIPTQDFERGFDPNSYLFDLVIRGAAERYGEIDDELKERINHEFEEIKSRNLATYLLLFRQIKDFLDEQGISRGFGRGGIIASVIAYCLGITRIDPLHYGLAPEPLAGEDETFPQSASRFPAPPPRL